MSHSAEPGRWPLAVRQGGELGLASPRPAAAVIDVDSVARDMAAIQGLAQKYPWLFPQADKRDLRTVAEVIDLYLADAPGELGGRTFENRERLLLRFKSEFGSRRTGDSTPFELKQFIFQNYPGSAATRHGANAGVQRAMNWAANMRLIRENPFRGLSFGNDEKKIGRDMHLEELQALLRACCRGPKKDLNFFFFLIALKMTGARPGELSALQWSMIDWARGIAKLPDHKTKHKTKRPRIIVFPPAGMKLLCRLRRHQHGSAAFELLRILENAPNREARIRDVVPRLKRMGFSYRALYAARQAIGATYCRKGGWGEHGHTVYHLPADAGFKGPDDNQHVFLCSKFRRWTRTSLGTKFGRLRKQLGLPMDCKLYGLRHFFITAAVRRNANLKGVATLVGHCDTRMIESTYCHVDQDFDFLQATALQATGQRGLASPLKEPAAGEAFAAATESMDSFTARLIRRLVELEEAVANTGARPRKASMAEPHARHRGVHRAAAWAILQEPTLASATDQQVFEWLKVNGREFRAQLPPTAAAWCRYIRTARRLIDGSTKREARLRQRGESLAKAGARAERRERGPAGVELQPRHKRIHKAVSWALAQEPRLVNAADWELFTWLQLHAAPDLRAELPPSRHSFERTLYEARWLIDGVGKQEGRRLARARLLEKGGAA